MTVNVLNSLDAHAYEKLNLEQRVRCVHDSDAQAINYVERMTTIPWVSVSSGISRRMECTSWRPVRMLTVVLFLIHIELLKETGRKFA